MKKTFIFILTFFLSGMSLGADYSYDAAKKAIVVKTPQGSKFIPASTDGNTYEVKNMKADTVATAAGASPPGFIPIGGMVAVMNRNNSLGALTGSWTPPATGAIKDGFMRADGGTVPACSDCVIPAGTTLPNMTNSYPRGNTTTGTTGGANTKDISHAHGISHVHQWAYQDYQHFYGVVGKNVSITEFNTSGTYYLVSDIAVFSSSGTSLAGVNERIGPMYTGGVLNPPTGADGSTAASTTQLSASQNFEPSYVEVVWVIRVK